MKRFFIKSVACISIAFFLAVILPSEFSVQQNSFFLYSKVVAVAPGLTPEEYAKALLPGGACNTFKGQTAECIEATKDPRVIKILTDTTIFSWQMASELAVKKISASGIELQKYSEQTADAQKTAQEQEALVNKWVGPSAGNVITTKRNEIDKNQYTQSIEALNVKLGNTTDPAEIASIKGQISAYQNRLEQQNNIDASQAAYNGVASKCPKYNLGCKFKEFVFGKGGINDTLTRYLNGFLYVVASVLAWLLGIAGNMFDVAVGYNINIGQQTSLLDAVKKTWVIFRDIINISFIFLLLYISIRTIIQGSKFQTKKLLSSIIVAALLINFSLMITKVVIDVGNVFMGALYNITLSNQNSEKATISSQIMQQLPLTTLYSYSDESSASMATSIVLVTRILLVSMVLWALVQAAILLIARVVVFFILMALSPIGFIGEILPKLKTYSTQWLDNLWGQVFVGPIFMFFMVLLLGLLRSGILPSSIDSVTNNNGDWTGVAGIFLNVFIVIGFIIAAVKITKELSGKAGAMATGWGADVLGLAAGKTLGLGAFLGRNTIGRLGSLAAGSEAQKEAAARKGLAGFASRMVLRGADTISKKSFDARGSDLSKMINKRLGIDLGKAGGKDGFTGQQKWYSDFTKRDADLMKRDLNDPKVQAELALMKSSKINELKANKIEKKRGENDQAIKKDGEAIEEATIAKTKLKHASTQIDDMLAKNPNEEETTKLKADKIKLEAAIKLKGEEIEKKEKERGEKIALKSKGVTLTEKDNAEIEKEYDNNHKENDKNKVQGKHIQEYAGHTKSSPIARIVVGKSKRDKIGEDIEKQAKGKNKKDALIDDILKLQKETEASDSSSKKTGPEMGSAPSTKEDSSSRGTDVGSSTIR